MPLHESQYGNLQNYKFYLRPNIHAHYGSPDEKKKDLSKHKQNVQSLLLVMSKNCPMTTWDLAKISIPNDTARLREREKIYRRLIVGRKDNGRHASGILEMGLVVKDGKSHKTGMADKYRLSLYGVLYCIDVLNLSAKDIDTIAVKYSDVLPKVFGRWKFLKETIGDKIYGIRLLANGLLADNPQISVLHGIPFYELMSYIHIKYQRNFESMSEEDLAEQISYWFYVNLLYRPVQKENPKNNGIKDIIPLLEDDADIKEWFMSFVNDAKRYYKQRYDTLRKS